MAKYWAGVCLLCAISSAGCVQNFKAYEGPELSDQNQARVEGLKAPDNVLGALFTPSYLVVGISCVDGVETRKALISYAGNSANAPEVLLAPGRHYLTARFYHHGLSGSSVMWLDAQAGHVYQVKIDQMQGRMFRMWLVEQSDGSQVGGLPGGEPGGSGVTNKNAECRDRP